MSGENDINDISREVSNFQPGEILILTAGYTIPDPFEYGSEQVLNAGMKFEFIRYVDPSECEVYFDKPSGLKVKIFTDILSRLA